MRESFTCTLDFQERAKMLKISSECRQGDLVVLKPLFTDALMLASEHYWLLGHPFIYFRGRPAQVSSVIGLLEWFWADNVEARNCYNHHCLKLIAFNYTIATGLHA